ncbi:MAG: hypothetical protein V4436_03410 [Patescibacteria group bacterium]
MKDYTEEMLKTSVESLVPKLHDGSSPFLRGVETWKDVSKLGLTNLTLLLPQVREKEKMLTGWIKRQKDKQSALRGKSGEDFKRMAEDFENPTVLRKMGHDGVPEPVDEASKSREARTTTFNCCGWCQYAGYGTFIYRAALEPSCTLMAGDTSAKAHFDTPCMLQSKTAEEIAKYVKKLEEPTQEFLAKREGVRQAVKLLQTFKQDAPERPCLTSLRPFNYFKEGEVVVAYIPRSMRRNARGALWAPARILRPWHNEGGVTIRLSKSVNPESEDGDALVSHPEILKRTEFEFFRSLDSEGFEFFRLWLANIRGRSDFQPKAYLNDLLHGRLFEE